jgi:tRNA G26 N,N-dimethylase Trm1
MNFTAQQQLELFSRNSSSFWNPRMKLALAILVLTAPVALAQSSVDPASQPTCASPSTTAFDVASASSARAIREDHTALEEQLGLHLESAKGPVPVLVIDSISRPSEN